MLIWIFLGLSVIVIIGTVVFMKREQRGGSQTALPRKGEKRTKRASDLWGVKTIKKGVLCLENNNYNLICRLSSADYALLSAVEQDNIEEAAIAALKQISFPIKIIYTAQSVDTEKIAEQLRQAEPLTPILGEFAQEKANFLEAIMADRAANARHAYLVIPFASNKSFEHVLAELQARLSDLAQGLKAARLKVEILDSYAVLDLLSHLLRPNALLRPSQAARSGGLANYTVQKIEDKGGLFDV